MHDTNRFLTPDQIPSTWKEIKDTVGWVTGCKTILAGGALRDLIKGQVPKDLDIFVFGANELYTYQTKFEIQEGWKNLKRHRDHAGSRAPDSRGYQDDATYYTQGLLVNIISYKMEEYEVLFENFDISSSMIMFDGAVVTSDPLFAEFVHNNKVSVVNDMRRTNERLERLSERYDIKVEGMVKSNGSFFNDDEDSIPF